MSESAARRYQGGLIFVFFLWTAYRALTQSITIDEAAMSLRFVEPGWLAMFTAYSAENHVLYAFLARICISVFGLSEGALRMPSVLACLLFLIAARRFLKRMCGPIAASSALTVVALNPVIQDMSVAARGYMLALAFFAWGLLELSRADRDRELVVTAVLFALSVASNLTFAYPTLAALTSAVVLFPARFGERCERLAICLLLPMVLLTAAILAWPLQHAERGHFYYGAAEPAGFLWNMVETSLVHDFAGRRSPLGGYWGIVCMILIAMPVLLGTLVAAVSRESRKRFPNPWFLYSACTFVVALAGGLVGHWWFGVALPLDRTGIYLIVLLIIGVAGASASWPRKWPSWLTGSIAAAVVLQCALQLNPNYFGIWRFDAPMKRIMGMIAAAGPVDPKRSTSLSCDWPHAWALDFYRRKAGLAWLQPVERVSQPLLTKADYYVGPQQPPGWRVLLSDRAAGVVLAQKEERPEH